MNFGIIKKDLCPWDKNPISAVPPILVFIKHPLIHIQSYMLCGSRIELPSDITRLSRSLRPHGSIHFSLGCHTSTDCDSLQALKEATLPDQRFIAVKLLLIINSFHSLSRLFCHKKRRSLRKGGKTLRNLRSFIARERRTDKALLSAILQGVKGTFFSKGVESVEKGNIYLEVWSRGWRGCCDNLFFGMKTPK